MSREIENRQTEVALAGARALLSALALAALARHPAVSGGWSPGLRTFLVLHLALAFALWLGIGHRWGGRLGGSRAVHAFDVLWAAAASIGTAALPGPGLACLVLIALSAAYRWGLRAALGTVAIVLGLVFAGAVISDMEPASRSRGVLIMDGVALVPVAALAGYVIENERRRRERIGATERARVARELHDGAIQSLVALEMEVEALRRRAARDVPPTSEELERIQGLLRSEVQGLRELMQRIDGLAVEADELPGFLGETVARFARQTGIRAAFTCDPPTVSLSSRASRELAAIVQEALVNVRKHSGARNVSVRLASPNGTVRLEIEDDGRGSGFAGRLAQADLQSARKGPRVIRDRVADLGGELTVDSVPGRGTRLEVVLPADRR
jgi:signal transduction histidine kinase